MQYAADNGADLISMSLGRTPIVDRPMPAGLHRLLCITQGEPERSVSVTIVRGATAVARLRSETRLVQPE
jgi:hypothetical protein